ncbi:NAD(P)-binding protein [Corynebacterium sp. HMSC29G08]|uniref:NAD(P)-binding protein n=1 Tax=Corynebacterium sp. HMSC29G08 TaxID=1581069 RepID=UPI0009F1ADAC|nr:NAD(P)-binding protein [Corynebacterium sp. HMSC29G08]
MFKPYRRPTVAVIGAGVAGSSAAAECAFSGFDTVLFERRNVIGGRFLDPGAQDVSRRYHHRTPYLKITRTDGSPASMVKHLTAPVKASGAVFRGSTEVTAAHFDEPEGKWVLTVVGPDGTETQESFDVLVRATGEPSPWIEVPGRKNQNVDELYLHHGVEVVGPPNLLFVDGPHASDARLKGKSMAVAEARADYCRRYVRQLEIRGPGAITVKQDRWLVQPGMLSGLKSVLQEFDAYPHAFKQASNYVQEDRRAARH